MANEQGNSVTKDEQQQAVEGAVIDSGDFFDQLDQEVNGMVGQGDQPAEAPSAPTEATHVNSGSEQGNPQNESHGSDQNAWDSDNNPYKKRYKDSSREAVKMNAQIRDLKPFIPVLEAMKRDSGLVSHVREYLQNGGSPSKNVQQKLGLSEDFEYDPNEAVKNPDSDSAKVMNAQVEQVVNKRVGDILKTEKMNSQKVRASILRKKQEADFIKKHNLTEDQFIEFKERAQQRKLSYDDVYYLLNKDQTNQNVANATKTDMLNQMKNVRNMPSTASDSNNQGSAQPSKSNQMFDVMLDQDSDIDNLFG
jgi:hypothetical protein